MDFEWDAAKSARNRIERDLPFELAVDLFDGATIERVDDRRDYGEMRVRAIGAVAGMILHCVCTERGEVRRIISLRDANRRETHEYRTTYPA
jgi:uncharacterized DUF497 family protein